MTPKTDGHATGAPPRPGYKEAAERIVAFISAAGLQPGDRLPIERRLGEQLGISRSVLREALKVLAGAGIVYTRQGSGIYLSREPHPFATAMIDLSMPVDPEHMRSLFEFRTILESHATQLATERITHREVVELEAAVTLNHQGMEARRLDQFALGDNTFHQGIASAARNPFLEASIGAVSRLQERALEIVLTGAPGSLRVAAEQHAAIFAAIRDGQADAAAAAMKTHIQTVLAAYQQEVRRRLTEAFPPADQAAPGTTMDDTGR